MSTRNHLREYGLQIMAMLASVKIQKNQHLQAHKLGILEEEESETVARCCVEIDVLTKVYSQQLENILERIPESNEDLVKILEQQLDYAKNTLNKENK